MAKSLNMPLGNRNLRGKRTMLLRCRCCVATNLRPIFEARRIAKEMRDAK